jgi:hypothetical protein
VGVVGESDPEAGEGRGGRGGVRARENGRMALGRAMVAAKTGAKKKQEKDCGGAAHSHNQEDLEVGRVQLVMGDQARGRGRGDGGQANHNGGSTSAEQDTLLSQQVSLPDRERSHTHTHTHKPGRQASAEKRMKRVVAR